MNLPVLIISFNNHDFVENTIQQLRRLKVSDIWILDNASTWDDTRQYLDQLQGCRVIRNPENYGPICWTRPEIYSTLPPYFCVTDPDLQFNPNLPENFLEVMVSLAERYGAMKVGFALDISDSDEMFQYPDYDQGQSIVQWEGQFWQTPIEHPDHELYLADVDTTFHVFNKRGLIKNNLRIAGDFVAKHLPWYRQNALIPPERMTLIYRQCTWASTTARFHMRQHEGLSDVPTQASPITAPPPQADSAGAVPVHLYQIAYSAEALSQVQRGYRVLDNMDNERADWFELWPMRRYLKENVLDENAFYGFFSPKFGSKTQLSHAQVTAFVRQAASSHDVVLFSPQPDMGAFFLNVFEQAETFDSGFIEATEAFLRSLGDNTALRPLVMDSSTTVFSNYFVARPSFWREWLRLVDAFVAVCDGEETPLKAQCTAATTYGQGVQRKVFIQERLASYLLVKQSRWRVKAANPFGFGWSMTRFRDHPHEAAMSDALKTAFLKTGYPEYMRAFAEIRQRFSASAPA